MPRKQFVEFIGAIFHVWARRVDRWPLFVDDDDRERYLALLGETVERFDWKLWSFCLMPNHVHLLVELREANLAKGMQWLHMRYARYFNDRHGRVGRLFEHRYGRELVGDELYFLTVVRYIEENPVKPKLVRSADEWPWSSRGMAAAHRTPPWVAEAELTARRHDISGVDIFRNGT